MKNNTKYISLSIILLVIAGGVFSWLYFSGRNTKKVEIKNEIAAEGSSGSQGPTSESSNDRSRSDLGAESTSKGSTSESPEDMPRLNLNDAGIINDLVSWGFEKSSLRKIDTVIIHSTYNALGGDEFSLSKILDIYKSYGVAPHYIIDRGGKIYRLVSDENIAYHAGESKMPDGRTGVNNFSIGIEMINNKTDNFTSAQYDSLNDLLKYLRSKHSIKYVLGHDQIAPGRKDDPWNINWNKVVK